MESKAILSIDPGDTTGWVFCVVKYDGRTMEIECVSQGEVSFPNELEQVMEFQEAADVIIVEDYIIRQPHIGSRCIAIRVIGAVQYAVAVSTCGPLIVEFQQPSEKNAATDERLSLMGLKYSSPHVRDALRHVFVYILKAQREIRKRTLYEQ